MKKTKIDRNDSYVLIFFKQSTERQIMQNVFMNTAVARVENGEIVVELHGKVLVVAKKIGIQFDHGKMTEPPGPGHEKNSIWGTGDVTIGPVD